MTISPKIMRPYWVRILIIALALSAPLVSAAVAADTTGLMSEAHQAMDAKDYALAAKDYLAAASAGNAEAQAFLADMYRNGGEGVDQDYYQALLWAQKAADQGSTRAMITLGVLYRDGLGVPQDASKALREFEAASTAGDMKGPRYVGLFYEAAGDAAKAFAAYQLGADRGDITSQYLLGKAYELGTGVTQDYALAAKWYATSASRGDIIASDGMVGLASLYERGLGVAKDTAKSIALYRQAAAVGNAAAKAAIARLSPSP